MSINVTVKGNPVSIKRGKMVTTTNCQTEFDKRRKLRLQQVRQQSNHIAADIREKLKREKDKKLSEIEKEGQEKLKNWENRKLLDLQEQYDEALDEFGLAHQAAADEVVEEQAKQVQAKVNRDLARSRGGAAFSRLQLEQNQKNYEKAKPQQRKNMSRDIENSRSAAVANIKANRRKNQGSSPFKRRKKCDSPTSDSDSENRVPKLGYGSSSSSESSVESPKKTSLATEKSQKGSKNPKKDQETSCTNLDGYINQSLPQKEQSVQTTHRPADVQPPPLFPYDTRISERIRRRTVLNKFCECNANILPEQPQPQSQQLPDRAVPMPQAVQARAMILCDCCGCPMKPGLLECEKFGGAASGHGDGGPPLVTGQFDRGAPRPVSPKQTHARPSRSPTAGSPGSDAGTRKKDQNVRSRTSRTPLKNARTPGASRGSPKKAPRLDGDEIPSRPKVTLRSAKTRSTRPESDAGVGGGGALSRQYDHSNRFNSFVTSTSRVEQIADDDVMTPSSGDSEADYREQIKQRDAEAHLRGQRAIQKEKIHRDYKTMMKKLPVLQKQERIGEISLDKPQYHMGRDRMEEYERQKQNRLDNAYEKLFVRGRACPAPPPPSINTLPRATVRESPPSLNLADYNNDDVDDNDDEPLNRDARLNEMLLNLQKQKMQLLREYGGKLDDYDSPALTAAEQKRKRGRTSPDLVDSSGGDAADPTTFVEERQSTKRRRKVKVKTRILRNTSTQTTPKPASPPEKASDNDNEERRKSRPSSTEGRTKSRSRSPPREPPPPPPPTVAKKSDKSVCCHKSCTCDRDLEILIKLPAAGVPEVEVCPLPTRSPRKDDDELSFKRPAVPPTISEPKVMKPKDRHATASEKKKASKRKETNDSWHANISKNSSSTNNSSSTSYLSLVDKDKSSMDKSGLSCTSSKPGGDTIDPRLMTYIKKLLFMPYGQLDDLSVSSTISEVSTPGQSVVDVPANRPRPTSPRPPIPQPKLQPSPCANDSMSRLQSVMKYFNITPETLQRHIDAAMAASSFNNTTASSQRSGPHYNTPSRSGGASYNASSSVGSSFSGSLNSSTGTMKSERTRMVEYTQIADHCTRKINDLTAKIEKVREEKKKIMGSTTTTTSTPGGDELKLTTGSLDDVDKNVLDIDLSLAERLKKMSPNEFREKQAKLNERRLSAELEIGPPPSSDDQLMERMRRLLERPTPSEVAMTDPTKVTTKISPPPLMLDIPKLAPLSVPSLSDDPCAASRRRRPPPTSIRLTPRTDGTDPDPNAIIVPHELSTIIEGDSQPNEPSPRKAAVVAAPSSPKTPCPCKPPSTSSGTTTTTDKSELDAMEQMLHNIGMEWAIATLRKTREAMAKSSSSSDNSNSKSSADISLKDFLIKHATPTDFMTDSREESKKRQASTPVDDSGGRKAGGINFLDGSDISSVQNKSGNNNNSNSNKEKLTLTADLTDPLDKNVIMSAEGEQEQQQEQEEPTPKRTLAKEDQTSTKQTDGGGPYLDTSSARSKEVAELLSKFRQINEADEGKADTSSSRRSSINSSKLPIPTRELSPRKNNSKSDESSSKNSSKDESKDNLTDNKKKWDRKDKDEPDSSKKSPRNQRYSSP